jgi:hypothetical protein
MRQIKEKGSMSLPYFTETHKKKRITSTVGWIRTNDLPTLEREREY